MEIAKIDIWDRMRLIKYSLTIYFDQFKHSQSLFSSIKSVLVVERSQSRVVLPQFGFLSFKFLISKLIKSICKCRIVFSTLAHTPHITLIGGLSRTLPNPSFITIYINHHVPSFWIPGWFQWYSFIPILRMRSYVTFRNLVCSTSEWCRLNSTNTGCLDF